MTETNNTAKLLEEEMKTFEENKEQLLKDSEGKFVLIKGKEVAGVYDTENDAINIGYEKFKDSGFLVKKIQTIEETITYFNDLLIPS